MSGFLAEVAKKLADRWLAALVLPGVLWITALVAADRLGQRHPFDIGGLHGWLQAQAANPGNHALATVLLAATGLLAAAAAVGLAASALGSLLQRAYAGAGERAPLAWLATARQHRWDRATVQLKKAIAAAANPAAHGYAADRATAGVRRAESRRKAIGDFRPERPTRIGDLFHTVAVRAKTAYGLDLDLAWPRLWAVLPDALRADLAASADAYGSAARLTAWGLLYALLAVLCWPAVLLGAAIMTYGWVQSRTAAHVLADLIETAMDLHLGDLAERLGVPADRPLTSVTGEAVTRLLRKG